MVFMRHLLGVFASIVFCAFGADAGFASGAAAAIAQSLYAGTLDGSAPDEGDPAAYAAWQAQVADQAQLIGASVGYITSAGLASNVSNGGSIAQSGVVNNYLSHTELALFEAELRECIQSGSDCRDVLAEYKAISEANNAELAACGDNSTCIQTHLARIAAAEVSGKMADVMRLMQLSSATIYAVYDFEKLQYDTAEAVASGADFDAAWRQAGAQFKREFNEIHCSGMSASECQVAFDTEVYRIAQDAAYRQQSADAISEFFAGMGIILDFVPVVGDVKGAAECAADVSWGSCLGAVAGLVPLLGDGASILLRRGDDVIEITSDGLGGVKIVDDAPNTGVPDGWTAVDDSIGAARPDLPDGYTWVRDADGNTAIANPDGTITNSGSSAYDDIIQGNVSSTGTYPNQMADQYPDELSQADDAFSTSAANGGVSGPASPGSADFDQILADAADSAEPIKFTVNPDGDLVISPHTVEGTEIKHSVLADGGGVDAAGEAMVVGNGDGTYTIITNNQSGHYQPPASNIDIANQAFVDAGYSTSF